MKYSANSIRPNSIRVAILTMGAAGSVSLVILGTSPVLAV